MLENSIFAEDAKHKVNPFTFQGNAKEYFGIWIVNLFLSIITLGIYTAWAKVRRLRYFYGNTFLDGHNFEYHAKPKQILIGRIIVVVLLVLYNILVNVNPIFTVLLIPYLIAFPWILNKAMRFNARVTSYRNIHFDFQGSYWRALFAFIVMPIIGILSLGLLMPFSTRMAKNYLGNNLSWGDSHFQTEVTLKPLYKLLGWCLLFIILVGLVCAGLSWIIINGFDFSFLGEWAAKMNPNAGSVDAGIMGSIYIGITFSYIAIGMTMIIYSVGTRNIAYNATALVTQVEGEEVNNHKLSSDMSPLRYVWILLSNLIAIICTLGLLRAWAAVRTWRYKVDHTSFLSAGTLDNLVSQKVDEGKATSAEFFDIEGIDLGL